ncbi:hypothetical protein BTJ39_12465 [Izhakiella australiensis]|uniref:Uncharacterized protein n=1 Tax=Izhakiella australiensis TaxID=1926881 RepID=A0A1S8YLY4_9GAMM|nr:hypothetical protein [Izhakiella australiensis]OON39837.1 hypothetical protein BTJ39_12465 [Izhakiella australiensis]
MTDIKITKMIISINSTCQKHGERILSSSVLDADNIKDSLRQGAQEAFISVKMEDIKWIINLGVIPASRFDTVFIPRLIQAFGERLARVQASGGCIKEVKLPFSADAAPGRSASEQLSEGEQLFRFACRCLNPESLEALLQATSVVELQRRLKQLLEGSWSSPDRLPSVWYNRFTASRLSIAAALYLLNNPAGRDWLSRSRPSASQLADWANGIGQREIPAEQVTQLLFANPPSGNLSTGQRNPSPLLVMHWLLPVWQQPAVRLFVRQLKGLKGVQQIETYLCRCLLRPDPGKSSQQKMHANSPLPVQIADQSGSAQDKDAFARSQRTSLQNTGRMTDFSPGSRAKTPFMLPQGEGILARSHTASLRGAGLLVDFFQTTSERDNATTARSKSMVTDPRQGRQSDAYVVSPANKRRNKPVPRWNYRTRAAPPGCG